MSNRKRLTPEVKRELEEELREYPYKLMSLEISGLGTVCNLEKIADKHKHPSDAIARAIGNEEINEKRLNAIEWVYERLSKEQKRIVQACYFEGDTTKPSEVIEELKISQSTYQRMKKESLRKFAITLSYI